MQAAKGHHQSGEYETAAEKYVAAAYEFLGETGLRHSLSAAHGITNLTVAATCLRIIGDRHRSRSLCVQGVEVAEMIGKEALNRPPAEHPHDQSERGIWFEFRADLKSIGGLPDTSEAYDRAERVYEEAGDPQSVSCEQFHMTASYFTKTMIRGTGYEESELDRHLAPGTTLTEWIDFKRESVPAALEALDDQEEWDYVF